MKKVVVADGHSTVRLGLNKLVATTHDTAVVGETDDGDEVLSLVERLEPDLLILGLNLKGERTGIEVCQETKSLPEPPRVMVYAAYDFAERVAFCLLGEADSFVHKSIGCAQLLDAVKCTIAGERVWRPQDTATETVRQAHTASDSAGLTAKEREVLVLLLCGCSNPEIAEELYVTVPTVRTHVRSILRKLGATCRKDLLSSRGSHVSNF
ncbi:MAG: response regulator [Rubrobacteraceae bacterium]